MTRAHALSRWHREKQTVSFTIRYPFSRTGKNTRIQRELFFSLLSRRNGRWAFGKATTNFDNKLTTSLNILSKPVAWTNWGSSISPKIKRLSRILEYRFIFEPAKQH